MLATTSNSSSYLEAEVEVELSIELRSAAGSCSKSGRGRRFDTRPTAIRNARCVEPIRLEQCRQDGLYRDTAKGLERGWAEGERKIERSLLEVGGN